MLRARIGTWVDRGEEPGWIGHMGGVEPLMMNCCCSFSFESSSYLIAKPFEDMGELGSGQSVGLVGLSPPCWAVTNGLVKGDEHRRRTTKSLMQEFFRLTLWSDDWIGLACLLWAAGSLDEEEQRMGRKRCCL